MIAVSVLNLPSALVTCLHFWMQNSGVRIAFTPDVSKRMTGGCSEAASTDGGPKLGRGGREGEVPGAGSAMGDLLAVAGGSPEPDLGERGRLADTGDTGSPCNPQTSIENPHSAPQSPALWLNLLLVTPQPGCYTDLDQSKFLVDLCCRKSLLQTLHADLQWGMLDALGSIT